MSLRDLYTSEKGNYDTADAVNEFFGLHNGQEPGSAKPPPISAGAVKEKSQPKM